MTGFAPTLFLCSLPFLPPAKSAPNTLTCRTTEGAEVEFKEGQRRLSPLTSSHLLHLSAGGVCHLETRASLECFSGDGEKTVFRNAQGKPRAPSATTGAWLSPLHACVQDNQASVSCFFRAGGEALSFALEASPTALSVPLTEITSLDLSDDLLCVHRQKRTPALECYALPKAPPTQAARLVLSSETGRPLAPDQLPAQGVRVLGGHACFAQSPKQTLTCFQAEGKTLSLKNKAGFSRLPSAEKGFFLGQRSVCALNEKGQPSCYALASGEPLEFRNPLGIAENAPESSSVLLDGDAICFLPNGACYVGGKRTPFVDASGRTLAGLPWDTSGKAAAALLTLRGTLLCGADVKKNLQCFDVTSGKAIAFKNEGGFPTPVDATRGFSVGLDGLCAVSAEGDAHCFRTSGESMAFKNGFGGKVPLHGIGRIWVAQ